MESTGIPISFRQVRFDLNGRLLLESMTGDVQEAALYIQAQEGRESKEALKKALAAVSVVWVPTEQVSLMQRFVPGKRRADWMAALPYALEESLSEPVENLHFVALDRNPQDEVSVAVITKERMRLWVEQLQQAGLDHVLLVADCFLVPPAEANESEEDQSEQVWSVYTQDDQRLLVRSGEYQGFAASQCWFDQLKQLHEQQHGDVTIADVDEAGLNGDCATGLKGQRNPCKAFNLRSGEFQTKAQSSGNWKIWQWSAILVAALIVVYLLNLFMQAQQHREQASVYQAQTEKLFKQRFPEVKRIINIRTQAKTGFDLGGSGASAQIGPSQLINKIEPFFVQYPKIKVTGLDWKASSGQLSFDVQAPQVSELQALAQAAGKGLKVELKVKNVSQTLAEGVLYVDAN